MSNWQNSKTLKDIAEAYQSVYEAKKGDGNLANNYPPYDKVTRGDIIAGARGEDQMGGKAKSKKAKVEEEVVSEYEVVASYLLENNFAETIEDADRIIENMSDNWIDQILDEARAPGVKPYKAGPTGAEVRADAAAAAKKKAAAGADKSGYGPEEKFKDWKLTSTPSTVSKTGKTVSQRMDAEKPYVKRMTGPLAREYGSRHAAEVTRVVKGAGEPQAVTYPRKGSTPSKEVIRKPKDD